MSKETQVATAPKKTMTLKDIIASDKMQEQFQKALPKHLSPERFGRIAITALTRTPKLQECTTESVMKCLLECSQLGLEPDGRRAYLIPYGKESTLIISYMGLVELMRRSGDVISIRAETVCEKDEFAWTNGEVTHSINWREGRGEIQAVYAEAVMKSGEKQTAVMTREEVDAIKKRSRSGNNGPWVTDYSEMAKKTVVRRLSKMMPLSSEIMQQVEMDDRHQFVDLRDVTPQGKQAPKASPFAGAIGQESPENGAREDDATSEDNVPEDQPNEQEEPVEAQGDADKPDLF